MVLLRQCAVAAGEPLPLVKLARYAVSAARGERPTSARDGAIGCVPLRSTRLRWRTTRAGCCDGTRGVQHSVDGGGEPQAWGACWALGCCYGTRGVRQRRWRRRAAILGRLLGARLLRMHARRAAAAMASASRNLERL